MPIIKVPSGDGYERQHGIANFVPQRTSAFAVASLNPDSQLTPTNWPRPN
jgi:hypothetical protein